MNDELTEQITAVWMNNPRFRKYFTEMRSLQKEYGIEAALQYGVCEVLLAITRKEYPENSEGGIKAHLVDDLIAILEMGHFDEMLDAGVLTEYQIQLLGHIPIFGGFFEMPQDEVNARIVKELRSIQAQSKH